MATYSTNFGEPSIEATNFNDLKTILQNLPDNTSQLISPRDVRDAIFTTWEQEVFTFNTVSGNIYIGTDNGGTVSNYRYKMLFGKKELQPGNVIMDSTLLSSDTDIFIYNNKSDSNLSQQDTKVSFLAGDDFSSFPSAPYIEATKTIGTSSNWIDLNITNPASGGIVEINSDVIELGDSGWIIDNTTGDLYPSSDGLNIGLTGTGNRVGTIFLASKFDYLNNIEFQSGTAPSIIFDTDGKILADSIEVENDLRFRISATSGYFLSTDSAGNAIWAPGRINTVGITAGYMSLADGISDVYWTKPYADATGVTQGYLLMANSDTRPSWRSLDNIDISGATAGYVLGSDGSKTKWVSNVTGAADNNGAVQFNDSGFLGGDNSNFSWDNSSKILTVSSVDISSGTISTSTSNITTANITTASINTSNSTTSNIDTLNVTQSTILSSNITSLTASNVSVSSSFEATGTTSSFTDIDASGNLNVEGESFINDRFGSRGIYHNVRYVNTNATISLDLNQNDHVSVVNSNDNLGGDGQVTIQLPDVSTDNVVDGQEMIIRTLDISGGGYIEVQSNLGIRQIGATSAVTSAISLSQNQAYHYTYIGDIGYWVQIV